MKREEALQRIKPHLTEHRYVHTLGVLESALMLAERYGADQKKAELAAIFHDYAKFRDKKEMRALVQERLSDKSILDYGDELLHAPCGAYYVAEEVGLIDEEVLNAIRYHTTGRPGMSLLEKIIFLADYIEPGRVFKGVEEVREIAQKDLDKAIVAALANTVSFLLKRGQLVYPKTIDTYNHLIAEAKKA
ncbi:bis(5'-nucleosyl)-tetraphosphatase (symmetrical) YqeK [Alkalihalobacillus oceani]|uniref:bis(5'-nucleosyl)-tetraphosphatase (symmetrical) YqeK n=1 Tax=Halalkalibacter oceani TaxID=1653776 RepID=UPI00203BAB0A|nr:bis(5'-nucleosyl)-tetraphosphatase (symmetrical) YqeK [Halalkalibacter oceani]MCM3761546.1 bis(5'-nucleosyl)-tetraphosphatase (symmetrical) YqeK [Halalkalibacter oceani]